MKTINLKADVSLIGLHLMVLSLIGFLIFLCIMAGIKSEQLNEAIRFHLQAKAQYEKAYYDLLQPNPIYIQGNKKVTVFPAQHREFILSTEKPEGGKDISE